jgi:hypothetical protein
MKFIKWIEKEMSDKEEVIIAMKNQVFLAAITGYAGAGLEPSTVISNAAEICDQISINENGKIIQSLRIE